jgi:hypothetical protein
MAEYAHLVAKAIKEVNINALYSYKKRLILYHNENIISKTIHDIQSVQWNECKEKFLSMIKYICRTFPSIVLQSSLLEFACNNNFVEFAQLILVINKRNNVEVNYDFNTCFKLALSHYLINIDIIEWINSINTNNIFNINYVDAFTNALKKHPEKYCKLVSVLKDNLIDIDNLVVFKEICKIKSHSSDTINALSTISKNNKFDDSIYIECYLDSIAKNSKELYKWCIEYFTKNNYDYNDIDLGDKNELFISLCNSSIDFACTFAEHNKIDISYNDYYAFFKICTTYEYYIDWVLNKYVIPDDILIEVFKYILIDVKFDRNYKYLYKKIKAKNITTIFDDFDDVIHSLTLSNPSVLHWICKQTDKYVLYLNRNTKKHEVVKNNGIFNMINDLDKYVKSEHKFDCDICMDDRTHFVKLECNHIYCNDCTIKLYKCPMCVKKINTNITLLISNFS